MTMCEMDHLRSKPSLHSKTQSIVHERVHDERSHFMAELGSSPSAHIGLKMKIYVFSKNERNEMSVFHLRFMIFIFDF